MTQLFEDLASLDRLIHEPALLAILTALATCASADFLYLLSLTGVSKRNLPNHLAKLADANLVALEKTYAGKTPRTRVHLTPTGRTAIARHWQRLKTLHQEAAKWQPDPELLPKAT
jgi:DNA-binding MarR family transcriptional regulator